MNEFEIIERYFLPLAMGRAEVAGFRDDAAVLDVPEGCQLVVTSDTLNEGVHFLEHEAPGHIAQRALRVNLSDLAAMGAAPLCYQLNIAFDERPEEAWLAAFSKGLMLDNETYDVFCSGGDTTRAKGAEFSVSITALGLVPRGEAVRRGGARDGDVLVLTGAIGDAALGLKVLQRDLDQGLYASAVARYRVPQPRVQAVDVIRRYARAAIDVSDGLLADALHMGAASGLGVEIYLKDMVFSEDVQRALDAGVFAVEEVLTGGGDYELILAVSSDFLADFLSELEKLNLKPFVAGCFKDSALDLKVFDTESERIDIEELGWEHF